jgi:hypothetical protein
MIKVLLVHDGNVSPATGWPESPRLLLLRDRSRVLLVSNGRDRPGRHPPKLSMTFLLVTSHL